MTAVTADRLCFRTKKFSFCFYRYELSASIKQLCFNVNFSRTSWHIIFKFAGSKNPIRRDGHRRGLVHPDVAVNTRALVKPALELRRVHAPGHGVLAAEM